MNSRSRFLETMRYGTPDHVPLFEEGLRKGVLDQWREQGLPPGKELTDMFNYDRREEISLNNRPKLNFPVLSGKKDGLDILHHHLKTSTNDRIPDGWPENILSWRERNHTLMLMVHWWGKVLQKPQVQRIYYFMRTLSQCVINETHCSPAKKH